MNPGDVISYSEMCVFEKMNLQRGMNFRPSGRTSIFLMSVRPNSPYRDETREDGKILIYEGHDEPKTDIVPEPKKADQPYESRSGTKTQNGLFYDAGKPHFLGKRNQKLFEFMKKFIEESGFSTGLFS